MLTGVVDNENEPGAVVSGNEVWKGDDDIKPMEDKMIKSKDLSI